ncbi:hypothetical protein KQH81_10855 [Clostridium cadaveris]|uniref:hypothetical protein n=1 Tax=Clostridium cadaveris TaxID=1529 RepID=UPI001E43CAC0|nr:hypothetical protein [Clostridium cadaveris]UFH63853.1 hypothetical protein KQH81_10855 [Clostridium cadaveris]
MSMLNYILKEIFPYIYLLIFSLFIEFNVKYTKNLNIKFFYTRGIRIVILIIVTMKLNYYGGLLTYLSFILTYMICVILDNRYRLKIESCWNNGTVEINRILKKYGRVKMNEWFKIRIKYFKKNYNESYTILRDKIYILLNFILSILLIGISMYQLVK